MVSGFSERLNPRHPAPIQILWPYSQKNPVVHALAFVKPLRQECKTNLCLTRTIVLNRRFQPTTGERASGKVVGEMAMLRQPTVWGCKLCLPPVFQHWDRGGHDQGDWISKASS